LDAVRTCVHNPKVVFVHGFTKRCGTNYDQASFNSFCWERLYERDRRVLVNQLGAWETALALML